MATFSGSGRHRPYLVLGPSLAVCLLILLAYLRQSNETGYLQSMIFPTDRHGETKQSLSYNPDVNRPRIELHPAEHMSRGPRTQQFHWLVELDNLRPDGVMKEVYLINGTSEMQRSPLLVALFLTWSTRSLSGAYY